MKRTIYISNPRVWERSQAKADAANVSLSSVISRLLAEWSAGDAERRAVRMLVDLGYSADEAWTLVQSKPTKPRWLVQSKIQG